MESPSKLSVKKSRPGSTRSEREERGHRPLPKRRLSMPTSHVSDDVALVPPLPPVIHRDSSSTDPFLIDVPSTSLSGAHNSSVTNYEISSASLVEDKLGFLLSASKTISPADMEEITRLFTPPPRVPNSNPPRYSPDPEVIVSATWESLNQSSFASLRPGAWLDSHVINYILKVLVQPSVPGLFNVWIFHA